MSKKSDECEKFKNFCIRFEWKHEWKIKLLYSENGGAFTGVQTEFNSLGIEWEQYDPYKPAKYYAPERLNQTLVDGARTTLIHSGCRMRSGKKQ